MALRLQEELGTLDTIIENVDVLIQTYEEDYEGKTKNNVPHIKNLTVNIYNLYVICKCNISVTEISVIPWRFPIKQSNYSHFGCFDHYNKHIMKIIQNPFNFYVWIWIPLMLGAAVTDHFIKNNKISVI